MNDLMFGFKAYRRWSERMRLVWMWLFRRPAFARRIAVDRMCYNNRYL